MVVVTARVAMIVVDVMHRSNSPRVETARLTIHGNFASTQAARFEISSVFSSSSIPVQSKNAHAAFLFSLKHTNNRQKLNP